MRHKAKLRRIPMREYVSNIVLAYLDASEQDKADGKAWYPTAYTFALGLSEEFGIPLERASAIIAVLSPQISWERNCIVAYQLCHSDEISGALKTNVRKAERILRGEAIDENLKGTKVNAFHQCIYSAGACDIPCIDHHALGIALGRVATEPEAKSLSRRNIYDIIATAYIKASKVVGVPATELQAVTWVYWRRSEGD